MKRKKRANIESISKVLDFEEPAAKFHVSEDDIEQDIVLRMPPKEEKIIKAKVHFVGKVKPRLVLRD